MFIPFFPSSPRYFLTPLRYYGLTPPSIPRVPKITFSHHPPPVFPYFSLALRRVSSTRLYLFSSLASSLPRSFESSTSYAWKGQEGRKEGRNASDKIDGFEEKRLSRPITNADGEGNDARWRARVESIRMGIFVGGGGVRCNFQYSGAESLEARGEPQFRGFTVHCRRKLSSVAHPHRPKSATRRVPLIRTPSDCQYGLALL